MIIADNKPRKNFFSKNGLRIFFALLFLPIALYFLIPLVLQWNSHTRPEAIYFDAETTWGGSFISNGQFFDGAKMQSEEEAHSGQYSYKVPLAEGMGYGLSGKTTDLETGKSYRATVYFKSENKNMTAGIAVQGEDPERFYVATEEVAEIDFISGWRKVDLDFTIPLEPLMKEFEYFVYTNGQAIVYFDDLEIIALDKSTLEKEKNTKADKDFEPRLLKLNLSDKAYAKIKAKRDAAKEKGMLMTDAESWVKASLEENEERVPVKIRLKGDWADHLDGDKWSFRVKVKDPYSWNRLVVFSLQTPFARYFADEWVLHKLWEIEDVLTTRYDFGSLTLNDKSLGVYAYEEHFDKQLLEYKNRREGPIIRFVEDGLWDSRHVAYSSGYGAYAPAIAELEVADIQPFKEGRTAANPKLKADFEIARTLLHQYQIGEKGAAEIFDLERLAKYYAICDLMGAHHAFHWHNQRFYFNPVIGKLEPIGYDGHSGKAHHLPFLLGQAAIRYSRYEYVSIIKRLVEDEDFLKPYLKYLEIYTSPDYLESVLKELEDGLQKRERYIQQEFPTYSFDRNALRQRAEKARIELMPYNDHSVKAYWKEEGDKKSTLILRSFHEMPLVFLGTGKNRKRMAFPLEESRILSSYYYGYAAKSHEFAVPEEARYVFYKPYGIDTLFTSPISSWAAQYQVVPAQELAPKEALKSNEWYEVQNQIIRFRKGSHQIDQDVIVPSGYKVFINAGTQLDFQKGAKFLSYSPVKIQGNSDQPVRIISSDESANGFTVLQAEGLSEMSYAIFDHFNTLSDRGWQLTGAVTFYESDVNIDHCIFENNHCEDGLNLVRSDFYMEEVTVRYAPSDGFDADFCKGTIRSCYFENTGNDGIDFSGSQITIESCFMKSNGDKAISVGEDSEVRIELAKVDGAVIGAASKDLSYLKIKVIDLKNCNQGFAAYQKKPEYGPSTIEVGKYYEKDVKYLHTIAPGCTLLLVDKTILGTGK